MSRQKRNNYLEGPGFRISRHGRWLSIDTHRTREEHKALMEGMAKYHKELPGILRGKVEELEERLQKLNPLDVIANATLKNMMTNPETYKEYSHKGVQAYVEYLTLLCLKRPYWEGETQLVNGADLEVIFSLVEDIFRQTIWLYATETANPDRNGPPTVSEELRYKTIIHELIVRNPGYDHHLEDLLRGLFGAGPAAAWMQSSLALSIQDVIDLAQGVSAVALKKLRDRGGKAHEEARNLTAYVRRFAKHGTAADGVPRALLEQMVPLKEKKLRQAVKRMTTAWLFFGIGDTLSFTEKELADSCGVAEEKAKTFLEAFSMEFGSVSTDFSLPAPTHELQQKPLVRHANGFLAPAPGMLLWAIRPRLEALIKEGGPWDSYQKARGTFLVNEALGLMGQILPRAQIRQNLGYTIGSKTFELDGLVLFDTVAFLLEGKAGEFTPPARRGAPARMLSDLKELVAEPHRQALRARDYINAQEEPTFTTPDGKTFAFDRKKFHTIILVTVTAEPLDSFVTSLYKLKELGIFHEGELSWALQILDLRIIAEMVEFPSQFIHYVTRRLRLNQLGKVEANDEIDWFGHYLAEGLYFDDFLDETGVDHLGLQSYTTLFDDYYLYETGQRKTPAAKPRQKMPELFHRSLLELEREAGEGYVLISTTLLEIDWDSRKRVARYLEQLPKQSRRDGKIHDVTLIFNSAEPSFGITIMSAPQHHSRQEFMMKLQSYAALKKYQTRCQRWVAIGVIEGEPGIAQGWMVIDGAWVHDESWEELAKTLPSSKDT